MRPVTTNAELVAVKEQLMEMDKALRAERMARRELASQAKAEISGLRRELRQATPDEAEGKPRPAPRSGNHLAASVIVIAMAAAVAGFSVWYVDPLHTWESRPAATAPPLAQTAAAQPAPAPPLGSSPETHEFSRLNDAVRFVPAPSMPVVLDAANRWLDTNGQQACSVQSPEGSVSLVISGNGGDKPLLSALSRCATAVEQITRPESQEKP
jgi:hypothetical protein